MSSSSGCSLLLLLASSPSACLPSHFRRCLPALKTRGKHRVYLDYVAPDEEKPLKVFRSCQLVRKLHRIAGPAEIDLMVLSRGFKATESRPRMDHTVKEVLLWPDFDASGTHGDILRGAERISVLSEEDLDPSFDKEEHISDSDEDDKAATADFVVLGGTFDRLHAGHKILLTDALLRCRRKMTIGVTDTQMIKKKVLPELILPCQQRIAHLQEYLRSCDPDLEYNIVPISDPFGPSTEDPSLELIVGSQETVRGCEKVNEVRHQKGFSQLKVILVDMEKDTSRHSDIEEEKISSSTGRIRMLGHMLKPPLKHWQRDTPYVIGLTGGSATGKTSIGRRLSNLGAGVIDCDRLGHRVYARGTQCQAQVVQAFGEDVLGPDGNIDRRALGAKVFGHKDNQRLLESIVWPEIQRLAESEIRRLFQDEGKKIVVLDAAVLLKAQWHESLCHQVWGCVIPEAEAVARIVERDGKTEEEAMKRLSSQPPNQEIVDASNVVFCTQWDGQFTQKQVEMAWQELEDLTAS